MNKFPEEYYEALNTGIEGLICGIYDEGQFSKDDEVIIDGKCFSFWIEGCCYHNDESSEDVGPCYVPYWVVDEVSVCDEDGEEMKIDMNKIEQFY